MNLFTVFSFPFGTFVVHIQCICNYK